MSLRTITIEQYVCTLRIMPPTAGASIAARQFLQAGEANSAVNLGHAKNRGKSVWKLADLNVTPRLVEKVFQIFNAWQERHVCMLRELWTHCVRWYAQKNFVLTRLFFYGALSIDAWVNRGQHT